MQTFNSAVKQTARSVSTPTGTTCGTNALASDGCTTRANASAASTPRTSAATLERFVFTDWFADLQMSAIRRRDVLDLRGRVMAATTPKVTNTTIVAVRTIFAEALYREDIEMNPCAGVTTVKEESRRRPLIPINGLRQMFQDCPGVFPDVTTYAAYNLAARTGMRRSEVLALQWESVSCDTRTVSVHSAWTNSFRQLGPTKTGNGRLLPVGEGVLQPLRLMLEDRVRVHADDFLFCDDTNGRPYHSHRWANGFRAALQAVGLDLAITPHSLRHSLNSHLLAAGVDAAKVRAYMGWSDRGAVLSPVQAGYTHWTDDALRDVADAVERLFEGMTT